MTIIALLSWLLLGWASAFAPRLPKASSPRARTVVSAAECSLEGDSPAWSCLAEAGYDESVITHVSRVFVANVENLRDTFDSYQGSGNRILFNKRRMHGHMLHSRERVTSRNADMEYSQLVEDDELVLVDIVRRTGMQAVSRAFPRAGPREKLHFDPRSVNAAIVTCGGLCPGLNNVIREVVHSLYYLYGAKSVWGITGGFQGFSQQDRYPPVLLTNEMVENIHHEGGTILRSARGGFDIDKIIEFLQAKEISMLFVIGGDGTHRAAYKIHEACVDRELNIAVAGIPKTIDNDVDYIDRSFGFVSSVEAAQAAIRSAKTEAMCFVPNAVAVVKLMGRSAGFLAAHAALGSGDVDAVLVPEVPIVLDGPDGILPHIRRRVQEQQYAVVVVAEGAGENLLGELQEKDAGGNKKLPPIAEFMVDRIKEYFADMGEETSIKYIDPSYMVRSVPANAADSLYCMQLAQNAVHGAMAGYTGFSSGLINNRDVLVPIPHLVATSPRTMNPFGTTWERVLAMSGQPNTAKAPDIEEVEVAAVLEVPTGELERFPSLPEPPMH